MRQKEEWYGQNIHCRFYTPQKLSQRQFRRSLPLHRIQHLLFLLKSILRRNLSAHRPPWASRSRAYASLSSSISKIHRAFTAHTTRRASSTQRTAVEVVLLVHQRDIIYNPRALPIHLIQRRRNLPLLLRHRLPDHCRSSLCSCSRMSSHNTRTPTRRPHILPSSYRPRRPTRRSSRRATTTFSSSASRLPSSYSTAHFSDFVDVV